MGILLKGLGRSAGEGSYVGLGVTRRPVHSLDTSYLMGWIRCWLTSRVPAASKRAVVAIVPRTV